jgi:GDP/UDP-N,N'-diacetylbacillosamine 2-epimerase (hydrolysing)
MNHILRGIEKDDRMLLQIVATGMHLSPDFGYTYKEIENDGFTIDRKLEILLSADTRIGVCKAMGLGLIGLSEIFQELRPDIVFIPVDRFESFFTAAAATVGGLPIAHMHGGEITEGAIDEAFRHSITKMAHIHFTTTEVYRNRVIQLGEDPKRVFNYGAPGIDNINSGELLSQKSLEESVGIKLGGINLLITYHPVTLEADPEQQQFKEVLKALSELKEVRMVFTKANADAQGRQINDLIDEFVDRFPENAVAYSSLGRIRYLSLMKYSDGILGNSSSGIIEAPSLRIGTVNIGNRQRGRIRATSIIDCEPDKTMIRRALTKLLSNKFRESLKAVVNPHGEGGASKKIVDQLGSVPLDGILEKSFYDLPKAKIRI